MPLNFNTAELADLMKNFYTLTGIRIVLFDEKYSEIFAYPKDCSPFCSCMRQNPEFYELCCKSDTLSFETCKKSGLLTMYKCHAGLIEATAPIMKKGTIKGYIIFGQVSDSTDKDTLKNGLLELSEKYTHSTTVNEAVKKIKFKSTKQLVAASKILEACTSYILLKEIIKPSPIELFSKIDHYISCHLSEEINISSLCFEFKISRTRLYAVCNQYFSGGIAAYIKTKRLTKAKELLQSTDMSVCEISQKVGFSDYNYFLKSFKKHYGVSTKIVRKKNN